MNTCFNLASATIVSLCLSHNAYAASSYTAQAYVSLEVVEISDGNGNLYSVYDLPAGLSIDTDAFKDFLYDADGDYSFADGIANTFVDTGLMIVDAQVFGETNATHSFAQAYSDGYAEAMMAFSNQSSQTYSIEMALAYEFSGEAIFGNPAYDSAETAVLIDVTGSSNVPSLLSIDTDGLDLFASALNSISFNFSLDAGQSEEIYTDILVYGESVSQVPLPATIFLMGPAVIGLFARKKLG